MMYLFNVLSQMMKSKKGQGMVEYGLIIGLIAIVVIVALTALGGGLEGIFNTITDKLAEVPIGGDS
ncbi:MAG TPA: Flp family type IVb pilin [Clostridiaceae bacterium]|jgi:pilus assembly protein Flp/PilA|nr:Flp family type IVb pilin [Clostridiaceae bacterium]